MTTPKFKAGDSATNAFGETYSVVVGDPDVRGDIVIRKRDGKYTLWPQDALTIAPRRYVVEMRVPKVGDMWLPPATEQPVGWLSDGATVTVPVVVKEAS